METFLIYLTRGGIAVAWTLSAFFAFRAVLQARTNVWRPFMLFWGHTSVAWALFLWALTLTADRVPSYLLSSLSRGLHIPLVVSFALFLRTRRHIARSVDALNEGVGA